MLETIPLQVDSLLKSYGGQRVVDELSFALKPGSCFGLLGPNGAGKTTTLKLCLGLAIPDGGQITLVGLPIPEQGQTARGRTGVVPQFDNLDPDFTVTENLLVFGGYFGMSRAQVEARLPWLLDFSGLQGKKNARLATLSGGMKRRLTLARALVNDPEIVFLDEPTTGLDPQARHLIWERLKQLKLAGKTLLLTTHFMDEAERLCDRLIIMDHGKKIAEGSPRELINNHIEPQVVEVYDDITGPLEAFLSPRYQESGIRVEVSGETTFFYCHDPQPLLAAAGDLRYVHRAANLEDVFLKLTGRELRD